MGDDDQAIEARLDRNFEREGGYRSYTGGVENPPVKLGPDTSAEEIEPRSLFDVVSGKEVAATIRESASQTLRTSLAREGLEIAPAVFDRLMRELGNNVAQAVMGLEIRK